jgi:hypothetical protein
MRTVTRMRMQTKSTTRNRVRKAEEQET